MRDQVCKARQTAVTFNSYLDATFDIGYFFLHKLFHDISFATTVLRMNLASSSGAANKLSFVPFAAKIVKEEGVLSLYNGLPAGILRQVKMREKSFQSRR
jgi:hypothetical protein